MDPQKPHPKRFLDERGGRAALGIVVEEVAVQPRLHQAANPPDQVDVVLRRVAQRPGQWGVLV